MFSKRISPCLFVFLLTRCIIRCFVLKSLLCGMNLGFCVVSHPLGWLPELLLFPCIQLNTPESAAEHWRTKKKSKRETSCWCTYHAERCCRAFFPPVAGSLLMKFGEKAQHAGNVLLRRLPPRQFGAGVSVCSEHC